MLVPALTFALQAALFLQWTTQRDREAATATLWASSRLKLECLCKTASVAWFFMQSPHLPFFMLSSEHGQTSPSRLGAACRHNSGAKRERSGGNTVKNTETHTSAGTPLSWSLQLLQ